MKKKDNSIKVFAILIGIAILVFGSIYFGTRDRIITEDNVDRLLNDLYDDIGVKEVQPQKGIIEILTKKDTLPDIKKYPEQVKNTSKDYIEIMSSTEKAGTDKEGWLIETANDFNKSNVIIDGKNVSVKIRGIASGVATDYITSKKYIPDAFSPSNEFWGKMVESKGIDIELIEKKLAGNTAGILISKNKKNEFIEKYGKVNTETIVKAVKENNIAMGYTNPYASSTGLNFLLSTLNVFNKEDLLSDKSIEEFGKFQKNIPFVSYTTLQMRESAQSGMLDAFIMEYQTYINSDLKGDYDFYPFGIRHDNPIYALGDLNNDKQKILTKFIEFCQSDKYQKLATKYGFNKQADYDSKLNNIDGEVVSKSQKLWKENKNINNPINAIFVTDISGSMQGEPLDNLKKSLLNASQYIGKENSIGLISFSNDVYIDLPIKKFDTNQISLFAGAVKNLKSSGSTAMFDGVIAGTKILSDIKNKEPNSRCILFVLSDGESNEGNDLDDVEEILKLKNIPVYTIGYNKELDKLKKLSKINEAVNIDSESEDVVYTIANLFNAEM
ncbi:MAG: VWA domain-containing protein [Clostridiales bacterium]